MRPSEYGASACVVPTHRQGPESCIEVGELLAQFGQAGRGADSGERVHVDRHATATGAQVAMFYVRRYTRALRPACSLQPVGSARAQRVFDRLNAALANLLAYRLRGTSEE